MKKTLSLILAAIFAASALASCASAPTDTLLTSHSSLLTSTSSANYADREWLESRLGEVTDGVTVGTAESLGIDMTGFEDDGYFIRTAGDETVVCGKTADGLDRAVRAYAKAYESGEVPDTTYHEGWRIKDLRIAGNPIADYTIVIPEDHHPNIDFAARELARLIEKATGVSLPTEVGTASGRRIVLSVSDDDALEEDGYVYEVKGGDLVISGAYERGCSNAVWRFLEKELDWTNLTYGDSCLTPADLVDVPEGTYRTETPAFIYLNMYRHFWGKYENERSAMTDAEQTTTVLGVCCHGMQSFGFAGEDYDIAREQMCYTSDVQYETFLENVTAYVEYQLAAGRVIGKDFLAVDIAQGDNVNFCTCPDCRKLVQKEGSQAGPVVYNANRLCEDLAGDYPGLLVQIFAYTDTKIPPKNLIPHENVRITFCYDSNCSNDPVDGSGCGGNLLMKIGRSDAKRENNASIAEYFEGWAAITDHITVWFYALDQKYLQYSTINNMYSDFRYFYDHNVDGIFWQCQFDGLGIQRVQHQLLNEYNRNIHMTEAEFEETLCRILEKEYGEGWENIRDYIRMWEAGQDLVPCWHCWGGFENYAWDSRFSVDFVERNFDSEYWLFEDALSLADSRAVEERLENLSCSMIYTGIYSSYYRAEARGDTDRIKTLTDRYDLMIERLYKNGFDPCGGGIYSIDGERARIPRTIEEWAEELREPMYDRIIVGFSGVDSGYENIRSK